MINLEKLIDLDALQSIQDSFSNVTKMSAITIRYDGKPITKPSNFTNFCNHIRKDKNMESMCSKCDTYGAIQSAISKKPHIYKCHAGLYNFAVPIIVKDCYVGAIICGQVDLNYDNKTYKELEDASNLIYEISKNIFNNSRINEKEDLESKNLDFSIDQSFIFNAINTIVSMARLENANDTEEFLYTFSDIMRYSLRNDKANTVYLGEEIVFIENYLKIQKARFTDRLDYSININKKYYNLRCPYMIIYPLVENFIKYVVESKIAGGKITIHAFEEDNDFFISIKDNGDGISNEKIVDILKGNKYLHKKENFSIYNINKRLVHLYGEKYKLQIHSTSEKNQGTLIKIVLPMDREVVYV